jgi:hypothetical protein
LEQEQSDGSAFGLGLALAGGTGALGVVALTRGLAPGDFHDTEIANRIPDGPGPKQRFRCVLPSLHQSWVVLPAMAGEADAPGFLDIGDLGGSAVQSLLNAQVLDHIKRMAFAPGGTQAQPPVVAKSLHLYKMLSNMRGIPFTVGYRTNGFGMQTMGDRVHYAMTGLGCVDLAWFCIPRSWGLENVWRSRAGVGAFPVGLAARRLEFGWDRYFNRKYPLAMPPDVHITPAFLRPAGPASPPFKFQSVDGGLVNNDPFDHAQYALIGRAAAGPVAGFPEPPVFPPEGSPGETMMSILTALFPALVNQARLRTSELAPAVRLGSG